VSLCSKAALARAAETLPDRPHFELSFERCKAFQAALDATPRPLPRLGRLLKKPSIIKIRRK
jgi:uncharacterized protein (DUF1778 family)